MTISEIITNALPNTAYGAVIGFTTGIVITAALDRLTDSGPYWDVHMGAVPYAVSRTAAPFVIILGGIACSSIGAVAGCVHSVAQQIF